MPKPAIKELVTPVLVMTLICVVTTLLLATVHAVTRDRIAEWAAAAESAAMRAILPQAATFAASPIPDGHPEVTAVVTGTDSAGAAVGHVFTSSARGYAGPVWVMTGIDGHGYILDVRVVQDDETPGLGKKIHEASFLQAFPGQSVTSVFSVKPDDFARTRIDAVAGATISSRAVADAVNRACAAYLDLSGGVD